jgi:hypothetical protein
VRPDRSRALETPKVEQEPPRREPDQARDEATTDTGPEKAETAPAPQELKEGEACDWYVIGGVVPVGECRDGKWHVYSAEERAANQEKEEARIAACWENARKQAERRREMTYKVVPDSELAALTIHDFLPTCCDQSCMYSYDEESLRAELNDLIQQQLKVRSIVDLKFQAIADCPERREP